MSSIPPNTSGIYQILCTPNGKIYVGSAKDIRWRWSAHRWGLRKGTHRNSYLQRAWDKYGADAFSLTILEEVPVAQLIEREQYYLDTLRPYVRAIGFNICMLASSTQGVPCRPETRQKISRKDKARPPFSEEHRKNIAEGGRGRKATPETRQRLTEAQKRRERHYPEETRYKMGNGKRGKKLSPERREKLIAGRKAHKDSPEIIKQRADKLRGYKHSAETRQNMKAAQQNRSPETHRRMSEGQKHRDRTTFFPLAEAMRGRQLPARHIVTTPDGEEILVQLSTFCIEHGLSYTCMRDTISGKQKFHKGYTARRATEKKPI